MTSPVELRTSISLSYNICDVLEKGEEGKELLQHKARTWKVKKEVLKLLTSF